MTVQEYIVEVDVLPDGSVITADGELHGARRSSPMPVPLYAVDEDDFGAAYLRGDERARGHAFELLDALHQRFPFFAHISQHAFAFGSITPRPIARS